MWGAISQSKSLSPEFLSSSRDLLKSTGRRLVLWTLSPALAIWLVLGVSKPTLLSGRFFAVGAAMALYTVLAVKLAERPGVAAQVAWQVGLMALITTGVVAYPDSFIRYYYVLLPFIAVVTINWQAAAGMAGAAIALMGVLGRLGLLSPVLSIDSLFVISHALLLGIVGWATTGPYLTLTSWAVYYARSASVALEQARNRQLELHEVREDLLKANEELARLTDRYKALQEIADEARQAKAEFVANVSHELRAPLNMVIGFSEVIARSPHAYGSELPPALLADVAVIQRNAEHLSKLINDVLDLSQIEAGRMALGKEQCSLPAIIEEVLAEVRPLYDAKGLYLQTQVPDDLPAVFCDPTRISQILINLLSNAGRFTREGGVNVRIESTPDELIISVTDTGPGISPEGQSKIFQPFQQLDSSIRREHGGSGLGLSISKQFVEMHGGRIWLESELGRGTTISFSLPTAGPLSAAPIGTDRAKRWVNPYASLEPRVRPFRADLPDVLPRFVLLEQGSGLRRLFSRYAEGSVTSTVREPAQAIAELQHSPAQALIVNSPQLVFPTGQTSFWQQQAELPYDTPSIVCWVPGREDAAQAMGAISYLVKPVTADQLLDTIRGVEGEIETILLVDDEPELLRLFARVLSATPEGYRVWRATSGARALEVVRERHPDLVVLDLIMPAPDGTQVLREIKADAVTADIPVIVLSSRDPAHSAHLGNTVVVNRGRDMTARELLALVEAVSVALTPERQSSDPGQPGAAPGRSA